MKTFLRVVACLLMAALAPASFAAGAAQDLFEELVPPELVLAHQAALGLSAEQRQAVERIQREVHPQIAPLLRQMREERDTLVALLKVQTPDEAAVLAQFDELNAAETGLKRLRLEMTVRTKNVLTEEQQAKALALQRKRVTGSAASSGTDTLPAKLRRVREGLEQWKREGRDVTPLRAAWERFRAAEDRGFYRQAREALDEAITLLEAPPARD